MLHGIDVSFPFDWSSSGGISFAFCRCQRQAGTKDASFDANWRAMIDLEARGAYEFALPNSLPLPDPAVRARNSWTWFTGSGPVKGTDLFCLDLEQSPVGQDETNAWAKAWLDEWKHVADRPPGVYLGSGYLLNRTGADLHRAGFTWLLFPRYPSSQFAWPTTFNPQPLGGTWADTDWPEGPTFWQFFGTNPASPVQYDGDVFNGTIEDLQSLNRQVNGLLPCKPGDTGDAPEYWARTLKDLGFYPQVITRPYTYSADLDLAVDVFRASVGLLPTTYITAETARQIHLAVVRLYATPGPKGDQGEVGPPGLGGPQGPEGPQGEPGLTPTKITLEQTAIVTEVV